MARLDSYDPFSLEIIVVERRWGSPCFLAGYAKGKANL